MKQWKQAVCAAALGVCMIGAAGAADSVGSLSPQGAKAYQDTIAALQAEWGSAAVNGQDSPLEGMWSGLSLARLIDFDGDGVPELYCGAGMQGQRLYTYENGAVRQLDIPSAVSNFGTDVSPSTLLYADGEKAYLVSGGEVMNGNPVIFYTKQGGDMVAALTYTDAITEDENGDWGGRACTLNGQSLSADALDQALDAFTAGMTEYNYSYWSLSDISGSPAGTVSETQTALNTLVRPAANRSTDTVTVNGQLTSVMAYKINGNNYFMLRDVAQALAGTQAQFAVTWNAAANTVELTTGAAYTPDGSSAAPTAAQNASLSQNAVQLDGKALSLTAYKVAGNNYFQLRELGTALGFAVDWDNATRTVKITA